MRRPPAALRAPAAVLCAAALSCAGAPIPPEGAEPARAGLGDPAARATLERFGEALEAGRFDEAYELLSSRWRAAYSPGRLRLDLAGAGPAAREATDRALSLLRQGAPLRREKRTARLDLPGGGAAVLVAEEGAWRVDALE
jgi:hypothetical protein